MTMNRWQSVLLTGGGVAVMIVAHGAVAWGGITVSSRIAAWLPWVAGGTVAFGLYHVLQAFGLYYVVQHIRGRHGSHATRGHANRRGVVERGPHDGVLLDLGHGFVEVAVAERELRPRFRLFFQDKNKRARPLPRNATVTIETVRPGDAREMFDFQAIGDSLESTTDVPAPHLFTAIVRVSHGSHTHTHEVPFSG